jgi:Uma2 family endonuclease
MYDVGMGTASTGLITFEEFERLPDEPGKRELLEGEIIEMPPADAEHSRFSKLIYHLLLQAVEAAHTLGKATELGEVFLEAGYKLPGNHYVQPDVSITHATQAEEKFFMRAPAIAVEVISSSNTIETMERKLELYFRYGAREVWHVFRRPLHFVIHVADSSRTIREGSVTTPLLTGFELPLSALQALVRKS